jgi:hypothetical protein
MRSSAESPPSAPEGAVKASVIAALKRCAAQKRMQSGFSRKL